MLILKCLYPYFEVDQITWHVLRVWCPFFCIKISTENNLLSEIIYVHEFIIKFQI